MSTYVIGDLQGCYDEFRLLLERLAFDPTRDRLLLAGDLVNRGPDSLRVLRYVRSLGEAAESVLGNHDLHLIAARYGGATPKKKDKTLPILEAPDGVELLDWLQQRPMLLESAEHDCVLTHAGIPPEWSLDDARRYARELESVLRSDRIQAFIANMYGNEPARWSDDLTGTTRLRVITNYFTRMRLLTPDGDLDFAFKEDLTTVPEGYTPWFMHPHPRLQVGRVLFGHWAALQGETGHPRYIGLDTGCVWGGHLTAYRVDDGTFFSSSRGCESCY
jgi:bis(5'-nucleosyl)-tetraphosphatase (symmetrical)